MIEKIVPASKVERLIQRADAVQMEFRIEDPSVLLGLDQDKSKVHAIGMLVRPGVPMFATWLEHEHFNPLTDREPLFEYRYIDWMDEKLLLVTIPFQDWRLFHRAAEVAGLMVQPGTLVIINDEGYHWFPMRSSRICTLENFELPFQLGSERHKEVMRLESIECDKIRDRTHQQYRISCMANN